VLLPLVWTEEKWDGLARDQQLFILNAITDFKFFFHKVFLPFHTEAIGEKDNFAKALPKHIAELCDSLQMAAPSALVPFEKDDLRQSIVVRVLPTGHMKSTVFSQAFPSWLIGINRRISILSASASSETAERAIWAVKMHLEENPRYISIFGRGREEDSKGPWQQRKIVVERPISTPNPTMMAAGAGTEIEGQRFDIALADDISTNINSATENERQKIINWMNQVVWARLHPSRRMLLVIGTMHHSADYIGWLRAKCFNPQAEDPEEPFDADPAIDFKQKKAVLRGQWPPRKIDDAKPFASDNVVWDPDLEVLWPEFWTKERLLEDYHNDPGAFALTRQHALQLGENQAFPLLVLEEMCRADGTSNPHGFLRPKIRAWHLGIGREANQEILEHTGVRLKRLVLSIDPASTGARPGTDPDFTAVELWCVTDDNVRLLLWLERFKESDPRIIRDRFQVIIDDFRPDEVVYEVQGMERFFTTDLARQVDFPIRERSLKKNKADDERYMAGFAAGGMMWYAWGDGYSIAMMSPFEQELVEYPFGKHDDTVTAALHAFGILRTGMEIGPECASVIGPPDDESNPERPELKKEKQRNISSIRERSFGVPARAWHR